MSESNAQRSAAGALRGVVALARHTLLEARRTRLGWLLLAGVLAIVLMAEFAAALAVGESGAHRVALGAAALRLFGVVLVTVFVSASMAREFSDRAIDWTLALAIPRAVYLGGRLLGYGAIAVSIALILGAVLTPMAPLAAVGYWTAAVAFELVIVAGVALLCALTFTHVPGMVCAVLAFYVFARVIDTLVLIAHGPVLAARGLGETFMVRLLDLVALFIPHLGRYAPSEWLVYGEVGCADLAPFLVQFALFMGLVVGASLFDLYRRNF
jgi:hypothetical protein